MNTFRSYLDDTFLHHIKSSFLCLRSFGHGRIMSATPRCEGQETEACHGQDPDQTLTGDDQPKQKLSTVDSEQGLTYQMQFEHESEDPESVTMEDINTRMRDDMVPGYLEDVGGGGSQADSTLDADQDLMQTLEDLHLWTDQEHSALTRQQLELECVEDDIDKRAA